MTAEPSAGTWIAILSTVSGAVVLLWRAFAAVVDKNSQKLDDCEKQHIASNAKLLELTAEVGRLKAEVEAGHDREITQKLCIAVLKLIGEPIETGE